MAPGRALLLSRCCRPVTLLLLLLRERKAACQQLGASRPGQCVIKRLLRQPLPLLCSPARWVHSHGGPAGRAGEVVLRLAGRRPRVPTGAEAPLLAQPPHAAGRPHARPRSQTAAAAAAAGRRPPTRARRAAPPPCCPLPAGLHGRGVQRGGSGLDAGRAGGARGAGGQGRGAASATSASCRCRMHDQCAPASAARAGRPARGGPAIWIGRQRAAVRRKGDLGREAGGHAAPTGSWPGTAHQPERRCLPLRPTSCCGPPCPYLRCGCA